MSVGDATPDDDLRPGALPTDTDRCERVTLRVPSTTLEELEDLVDAGEYENVSCAFRAAAYQLVDDHEQEDRQ